MYLGYYIVYNILSICLHCSYLYFHNVTDYIM